MAEYWAESRDLLKVLLRKCQKYDEDGVDVLLTGHPDVKLNDKNVDHLINKIDTGHYDPQNYSVNIATRLDQIFREYESPKKRGTRHWVKGSSSPNGELSQHRKPVTLIFFTDGIWRGCDKDDVRNTIKDFLQRLKSTLGVEQERPFTIEFVHFGEDSEAALYLDYLDDCLCDEEEGMMYVQQATMQMTFKLTC